MSKAGINAVIQLFGILGIIGSLIFVGLEMRQSQRIAIAGQQQGRAEIASNFMSAFLENGLDFQTVYFRQDPNHGFTDEEIAFRNMMHNSWFLYENDFYQYTQGLMDDATWAAKLSGIQIIYDFCEAREIYDARSPVFSQAFRAVVLSLPDKCS